MSATVMLATAIADIHEVMQVVLVGVTILFMGLGCVMRWRKLRQNKLDE